MVVYQCEKTLSDNYFADYDHFGPVERDPWPTPVNSEASSVYSDFSLDSEDEDETDEESQLETVQLKLEEREEIEEIASIEAIDNVSNELFKLNYLNPPNINGTDTNLSRYLFPSLPSQGSLYFG